MKTTIVQAFVLAALTTLGVCAPAVEIVARDVATAASPPGVAKGYTGELFNTAETPAGITVAHGPVARPASVKARSLKSRQITLLSEYAAPTLAYAQDDINYILALNEVIYVPAYSYIYWETGNAVAYFVNSNDEEVYFGTTWLAENLQAVYIDSLVNLGESGEFYSFAFPYYEIGLEVAGDPLPLYTY